MHGGGKRDTRRRSGDRRELAKRGSEVTVYCCEVIFARRSVNASKVKYEISLRNQPPQYLEGFASGETTHHDSRSFREPNKKIRTDETIGPSDEDASQWQRLRREGLRQMGYQGVGTLRR
jgi:hypothetical protein